MNRAGLNAIAYRIGTHSRFKESLLARLTTSGLPALRDLRTRDDDDPSIALLDAWATVADVLTFYQERLANENYLRTATERLSLGELARLIGYALRPGVAANVYLAFTLETAPGAPAETTIEAGTRVQSIPGPGEQAQTFETIETITGRAAWNAMRPRLTKPQPISTTMGAARVRGTATNLARGDALLIVVSKGAGETEEALRFTAGVATDETNQETVLTLRPVPKINVADVRDTFTSGVITAGKFTLNDATIGETFLGQTWNQNDLVSFALQKGFALQDVLTNVSAQLAAKPKPANAGLFALRKRASLFGYNAPDWKAMASDTRKSYGDTNLNQSDWSLPTGTTANQIFLDQVYKEIQADDWVVVTRPGASTIVARVLAVTETAQARYAISGKVTRLTLDTDDAQPANMEALRATTVYCQSEELELAELPDSSAVQGESIVLAKPVADLRAGQTIAVRGERSDLRGVTTAEFATLADVTLEAGYTRLTFLTALDKQYMRETVTLNANVALATHGESAREILGSGDASKPYQQFTLKQAPLTYVSAANENGAATTLQVFVNDVRWQEAASLYGAEPDAHVYITRRNDEGKTTVQFGDGKTGARPPTGTGNLRATFRKGIGTDGNVKQGQLSLLLSRPPGVKEVTNPLAAEGGGDAEDSAQARDNAPLTVLTLGRIVSLRDYEDFARAFAGVAKALATWTWNGQTRGVLVTVAGADGAAIAPGSPTYKNLLAGMQKVGDPYVPLRVETFRPAFFILDAGVKVDPAYETARVLAQVEEKVRAEFSFAARRFGQPVAASQLLTAMHAVPGVVAVDLNALYRTGEPVTLHARLPAAFPRAGADGSVEPAELLTLDPRPVGLGVMA
jgi:predicted phage baseplate assembly protein